MLLFTVTEKFPRMRGQGVNSNYEINVTDEPSDG